MTNRLPAADLFLASLVLMAACAFALPIAPLLSWPWRATGLVPIAAGVLLNLAADRALKDLGTTVKPFERSSALATNGVFRLSRNPMYLGMVADPHRRRDAARRPVAVPRRGRLRDDHRDPLHSGRGADARRDVRRRMDGVLRQNSALALELAALPGEALEWDDFKSTQLRRRSVRRTGGQVMTAPFLNPREEPATSRGPAFGDQNGGPGRLPKRAIPLFNRQRTGGTAPLRPRFSEEKRVIAMDYAKTFRAGIRRNNRSVTGSDFALIREITGGVSAITGKSDSGRRKRAGGFENGFAGGLAAKAPKRIGILSFRPAFDERHRLLIAGWSGSRAPAVPKSGVRSRSPP